MKYCIILAILLLVSIFGVAQQTKFSLDELMERARERNPSVQASALDVKRQTVLRATAFEIPKTDISLMTGQYNSISKSDNSITITQSIPFPTVFSRQHALNNMYVDAAALKEIATENELAFQVRQVFNDLLYLKARHQTLLQQDTLLTDLSRVADVQYKTGEGTLLAKTAAQTQLAGMKNKLSRNSADIQTALQHLKLLCQTPELQDVDGNLQRAIGETQIDSSRLIQNPNVMLAKQQVEIARQTRKLESSRAMPDLHVGYFNQTLIGFQNVDGQERYFSGNNRFQGFQAGLAFPLWFGPQAARIKSAKFSIQIAEKQNEAYQLSIVQQYNQALQELAKNKNSLEFFTTSALVTSDLLTRQSKKAFESGELDYSSVLLTLQQALSIQEEYLLAWYQYNLSNITLHYLNGDK